MENNQTERVGFLDLTPEEMVRWRQDSATALFLAHLDQVRISLDNDTRALLTGHGENVNRAAACAGASSAMSRLMNDCDPQSRVRPAMEEVTTTLIDRAAIRTGRRGDKGVIR